MSQNITESESVGNLYISLSISVSEIKTGSEYGVERSSWERGKFMILTVEASHWMCGVRHEIVWLYFARSVCQSVCVICILNPDDWLAWRATPTKNYTTTKTIYIVSVSRDEKPISRYEWNESDLSHACVNLLLKLQRIFFAGKVYPKPKLCPSFLKSLWLVHFNWTIHSWWHGYCGTFEVTIYQVLHRWKVA